MAGQYEDLKTKPHPPLDRTRAVPVQQPAHDVFVSYSTRDKTTADAIVARLEEKGIRCWVAPRDILPGQVWAEAIVQAIETSRLMVLVLSGESNHSREVFREVQSAVEHDVVVVPFRIESVKPTGAMAYYLASEHWLDAMTPPLEAHIAQLVNVAQSRLERTPIPEQRRPEVAAVSSQVARRRPTPLITALIGAALLLVLGVLGIAALVSTPAPKPTSESAGLPVSGKVTSELTGAALKASLAVPGTAATVTGNEGTFKLKGLTRGDVISVSAPGYKTRDYKVRDARDISIVLSPDASTVDAQASIWVANQDYQRVLDWVLRSETGYGFARASAVNARIVRDFVSYYPRIYSYGVAKKVIGYYENRAVVYLYIVKKGQAVAAQEGYMTSPQRLRMVGETVYEGPSSEWKSWRLMSWVHEPIQVLVWYRPGSSDTGRDIMTGIISAYS